MAGSGLEHQLPTAGAARLQVHVGTHRPRPAVLRDEAVRPLVSDVQISSDKPSVYIRQSLTILNDPASSVGLTKYLKLTDSTVIGQIIYDQICRGKENASSIANILYIIISLHDQL